jgi:hypothetical protein
LVLTVIEIRRVWIYVVVCTFLSVRSRLSFFYPFGYKTVLLRFRFLAVLTTSMS